MWTCFFNKANVLVNGKQRWTTPNATVRCAECSSSYYRGAVGWCYQVNLPYIRRMSVAHGMPSPYHICHRWCHTWYWYPWADGLWYHGPRFGWITFLHLSTLDPYSDTPQTRETGNLWHPMGCQGSIVMVLRTPWKLSSESLAKCFFLV